MGPASLFIIAQLVYAVFILGLSFQPNILQYVKRDVKNVLGVSMLAQDTLPPPDAATPPAEEPPPAEPSQSEPPSDNTSPVVEQTPTSSPSTPLEETSPAMPSPTLIPFESSVAQTEAVLNPETVIQDAEHIDKASVENVKQEESSLSNAHTSLEKGALLITFAQNKVKDIETNLQQGDFATTVFATTRLTDIIDRVTQEIQTAPTVQSAQLNQKISDFCQEADLKLRNQELSVSEASEQDVEISRAKCFEYR